MTGYPNSPKFIKGGIVLLDPETPRVAMPKSESICEEGSGSGGMGNNPEPSRDALDFWARGEKPSCKKQMALKKMLGVKTAKGDSSAIPGAVAKVKQAAEASTAKARDGSGTTEPKSGDSAAAADCTNGNDGYERDETQFAKRTGKISGKGGSPQAGLSPRKIVTVYKGTPSKVGETVSGTVLVLWRKLTGETVPRLVEKVTLAFQRVGPDKVEIEGEKHDNWIFRSTSMKAHFLVDRTGKFWFPTEREFSLTVIKAGEGKK